MPATGDPGALAEVIHIASKAAFDAAASSA
jgi:hypothetical protein